MKRRFLPVIWVWWAGCAGATEGAIPPLSSRPVQDALAAYAAGSLWHIERLRAEAEDAGEDTTRGLWPLLEELSLLLRCEPKSGPRPELADAGLDALLSLVRLEGARLTRFRTDKEPLEGADLLSAALSAALEPPPIGLAVRWPGGQERWPGERPWPSELASSCSTPADANENDKRARAGAELAALADAAGRAEALPAELASRVAHAYLDAARGTGVEVPDAWLERLLAAASASSPAGRRARFAAAMGLGARSPAAAPALAAIADDPDAEPELRWSARIGWVLAAEEKVEAATAPEGAPDPVRGWLDHVRARALLRGGDREELDRFARIFGRRAGPSALDRHTEALLLGRLVGRPPPDALARATELGDAGPAAVRVRWTALGRRALAASDLPLARAVFDRLASEAGDRPETEAARARVALADGDDAAFLGQVDALSRDPRLASRRELIGVVQDATVLLAGASERRRARVARALLDRKVLPTARPDQRLEAAIALLFEWSGRAGRPRAPSVRRDRPPPRSLALVTVEAEPPLPPPPPVSLPPLPAASFLFWWTPSEEVVAGLPPGLRGAEPPKKSEGARRGRGTDGNGGPPVAETHCGRGTRRMGGTGGGAHRRDPGGPGAAGPGVAHRGRPGGL